MTRLSRIHPYPAMIADSLATELVNEFVRPGDRVLDPFCGTGRIVAAAAERGAVAVGLDVNPLAILITKAKTGRPDVAKLERAYKSLTRAAERKTRQRVSIDPHRGRKVEWFPRQAICDMDAIVRALNSEVLASAERSIFASVLSATAREVSYCRKDQWKLHRLSPSRRSAFRPAAWKVFLRRARTVIDELSRGADLAGRCVVREGDARAVSEVFNVKKIGRFDVVISSPPYGDSRTTVQYGGISGLCLAIVSQVRGLGISQFATGAAVDRDGLGGRVGTGVERQSIGDLTRWWTGAADNATGTRLVQYLADLKRCCVELRSVVRRGGRVIFVLARRVLRGRRLKLDESVCDFMASAGFRLEERRRRRIAGKITPARVNRFARGKGRSGSQQQMVQTMREEIVLVFRKR